MRIVKDIYGNDIIVSVEEQRVIDQIKQQRFIVKSELDDRSISIADNLISRGVLILRRVNGELVYAIMRR